VTTHWYDIDSPEPSFPNGVYVRPKSDFSYLVIDGILIEYRNPGAWWHRDRLSQVLAHAQRISGATGLQAYALRADYRRNEPYQWRPLEA
jgi:hypothetical protein